MLKKLIVNNQIEIIIFFCICLSRLIVADFSNSFHSVDVGNYILAVYDYDISVDRPHLPGYFLYIYFFKFITLFIPNSNALFVVFQGIFQAISSVFIYKIIKDKFDLKYNLLIIALIFSIPMIYLYGILSEIYSIELLTISVFLYLFDKNKISYILPFMALVFGIRQSSGIFLLPAIFYIYYYEFKYNNYKIKDLLVSVIIFTVVCLMWFIPLTESTGGFTKYLDLLAKQNNYVVSLKFKNNLISFITYSIFYFVPIALLLIFAKKKENFRFNKTNLIYLLIILPQSIFYIFYHYNKGYALLLIPTILLFILFNFNINKKLIVFVTLFNLAVFFIFPGNIPSFNTQIRREFRDIDVKHVWLERFQYWWMPSLNSHNVSVVLHNDLEKYSQKIYNLLKDKPLIIDNSLILRARNISILLPKIVTFERTFNTFESYYRNHGIENYTEHNDISKQVENCYILIDKEYYNKFYTKISDVKLETEFYYIIKVKEEFINEYLEIDYSHF